ncbi:unnamed protein product [Adineta ricciae]|uniref:Protein quiver n=1 Tax=Adineta ricciae TaxID=249248 RepID=A0A814CT27_ADIRI|nr:unnamed protein product [Adineta ricciae]CAF0946435.1 unnamed protein product [Adineta ricciae]
MNKIGLIAFLLFFIYVIDSLDAIRCYSCLQGCPDPFNKANRHVNRTNSASGWCMKLKTSRDHKLMVIRTSALADICKKDKCKSSFHAGTKAIGCCCNTDLCNHSPVIISSLNIWLISIATKFALP